MSEQELTLKDIFILPSIVKNVYKYIGNIGLDSLRLTSRSLGKSIWRYYLLNYYFYYTPDLDESPITEEDYKVVRKISCISDDYAKFSKIECMKLSLEGYKGTPTLDFRSMNLTSLTITGTMEQNLGSKVISFLPSSLKYLSLKDFRGKVSSPDGKSYLPENILYVDLGHFFKQNIDNFPDSIEVLHLGDNFNQKINKYPKNLKHLRIGNKFNQEIINLPPCLISLSIKGLYHKRIELNNGLKFLLCEGELITNLPESLIFYAPSSWSSKNSIQELRENNKKVEIIGKFNEGENRSLLMYYARDSFNLKISPYMEKYNF